MQYQCWNTVISELSKILTSDQMSSWILPLKPVSLNNQLLTLGSPDEFFTKWIKKYYSDKILSVLKETEFKNISIEFIISSEPIAHKEKESIVKSNRTSSVLDSLKNKNENKFSLSLNSKYTFQNFILGPNNVVVKSACEKIILDPGSLYNPLLIHGDVGVGKTHLLQATAHKIMEQYKNKTVVYISSEKFTNQFVMALSKNTLSSFRSFYRQVDFLLIDDIQFLAKKKSTQQEFFHTFNELFNAGKQIIVTSDRPLNEIKDIEERIISRFTGGLILDIKWPTLETRLQILQSKSEQEPLIVPEPILTYIAENIETSNIRLLEGIIKRLKAHTLYSKGSISLNLVKNMIEQLHLKTSQITIEKIITTVAEYFKINHTEITNNKKTYNLERYIAIYLAKKLTNHSLEDIGQFFGKKSHSSIISAINKIKEKIQSDMSIFNDIKKLETKLHI